MKKIIVYIIGLVAMLSIAYAGYGEQGWGDCEQGWGLCDVTPVIDGGGNSGGGGGSSSYTSNYCKLYSERFKTCYTHDIAKNTCNKGCNEGFECVGFECVQKQQLSQPFNLSVNLPKLGLWEKTKLFLNSLLNPNNEQLSIIKEEIKPIDEAKEFTQQAKEEGIGKAVKENPITAILFGIIIVAIIAFVLAFMQYGIIFLLTNPLSMFIIILIGAIIFILWLNQL